MFEDGLHNRADVFLLNRNTSNRTVKGDIKVSDAPDMENVPCRIVRDEKVLFGGEIVLSDGDTVRDLDSGMVYEIRCGKRVRGVGAVHHSSYGIRIKSESGRHGN